MSPLKNAIVGGQNSGAFTVLQQPRPQPSATGAALLTFTSAVPSPSTKITCGVISGGQKQAQAGVYSPDDALKMMNSLYVVGRTEQETAIYRRCNDGSLAFISNEQFKLENANRFVKTPGSGRHIPVEKFWKESPFRSELDLVFKPAGTVEIGEYNQWLGYSVEPRRTRRRLWSLLRHIWRVICRRERAKFRYVIRWLAWTVQNPDKPAGVVMVLMSRKQGTGKSTLGIVMLRIFGRHGALIDDKDRLLSRFNDWVETISFVLLEEVLWAGDHRAADKLKSLITGETIQLERKFGGCRQAPNRLHMIMTTNHEFAVPAGVGDRRYLVLDVSDEHACDKAWFDRIYGDLEDGGTEEYLDFLQNLQLGSWHPRQILKTIEATEQQRMSSDTVSQWSQGCINADAIIGGQWSAHDLGKRISSKELRDAYAGYCRQHGLRPVNEEVFGKACTQMFGPRSRLSLDSSNRRPWGYDVPDGDTWQDKLNARLGIKS